MISRLFNTIKHLKARQVYHQLKNRIYKPKYEKATLKLENLNLNLPTVLNSKQSFKNNDFDFLNISQHLDQPIQWNFNLNGKLWTYNLTYFDYLLQKDMTKEQGLKLIHDFIKNINSVKDGLEPYPCSLRIINWIKFITLHKIQSEYIDNSLYSQTIHLTKNIEYHLLGNHLLENAFALLFSAYYFGDNNLFNKAKEILRVELEEQILDDGAHFELSPMYHCIILYRVLEAYSLVTKNTILADDNLTSTLILGAKKMLAWLENMCIDPHRIPHLNDSTYGIAHSPAELFELADRLDIKKDQIDLSTSGYRKMTGHNYTLIFDAGKIGPDYIPGHAHADTFNFILSVEQIPIIADTGISTYENNDIRKYERSTAAHNTVVVNDQNSSDVWSSFRVGRRAKVVHFSEKSNEILARHDGYKKYGVYHERSIHTSKDEIKIDDHLLSKKKSFGKAYFHFHPKIKINLFDDKITTPYITLLFKNQSKIEIESYLFAEGFNKRTKSSVVVVSFIHNLNTTIRIVA